MPNWQIDNAYANPKRFKKFAGSHPREFDSLFANLEKVMRLLKEGHKIGGFQLGFFRSEGAGVYRIGQTGVPNAKESRLYVYPDGETRTMYILNVGDKDGQSVDVNAAKSAVDDIKSQTPPKPETE